MDLEFGGPADDPRPNAGRNTAVSNTAVTRFRGPGGFLLILIMVGFAGFIGWVYCDMLVSHQAMQAWQEVPAKILRTDIQNSASHGGQGDGTTHRTTAEYEYTFDNVTHKGTKVCWGSGFENLGSFQLDAYNELNEHHRTGQPFHCFVNPADPSQAILYRHLRPEILVLFTAMEMMLGFPLLISLFGVIIQFVTDRREGQFRRLQAMAHPTEPWLWRADWTAGEMVVTRWRKKLGVASFALAWNLMAIPLYFNLTAAPAGTFWPRIIGFGLIGIGWLFAWGAVSTCRGPKSVLRLARVPVMCGDRFTSEIETSARPNASSQFNLALRCLRIEEQQQTRRQKVLWEETKLISAPAPGRHFGTHAVPVDFIPPASLPSTDHVADDEASRVVWRLTLDSGPAGGAVRMTNNDGLQFDGAASFPGLASFDVPIFSPHEYVAKPDEWIDLPPPLTGFDTDGPSVVLRGSGSPPSSTGSLSEPSFPFAIPNLSAMAAPRLTRAGTPAPAEMTVAAFAWRWIVSFFFASFFLGALFFFGLYWNMVAQWLSMRSWQEVPAKIVHVELLAPGAGNNHMSVDDVRVKYQYDVAGETHQGTKTTQFNDSNGGGSFQRAMYAELAPYQKSAQPFHCFVNPADPSQAVLYRGLRPDVMVGLAAIDLTVGLAFLLVPIAAISVFFTELRQWRFRRAQLSQHPAEPWLLREDWAQGEIVSSNRNPVKLFALAAVVWSIFTLPLWTFLPPGSASFGNRLGSLVLIGISWLLAFVAFRKWRAPKRSVLRISTIPAALGGSLLGQIETTVRPGESGRFRLALRCIRITSIRNSNNNNRRSRYEDVLWEEAQPTVSGSTANASTAVDAVSGPIAVQIAIPSSLPPADDMPIGDTRRSRILWRLVLDADPPTRFSIGEFEVPVFPPPAA